MIIEIATSAASQLDIRVGVVKPKWRGVTVC